MIFLAPDNQTAKSIRGFTLIELLVVVAIIGLLSSVVLASLSDARQRARDVKRIQDIKQVKTALELYYSSNNGYPSLGSDNTAYNLSDLSSALTPDYIATIPEDPSGDGWHTYQYTRGGQNSYGIWVRREDDGYCKTGADMTDSWWSSAPTCPF